MNSPQILEFKKAIIWDWNGTLLDDVDVCIYCMNQLLEKRNIPILSKNKYINIFSFPVSKYYEQAGFDFKKESFEKPAIEFIELYHQNLKNAELFPQVISVLEEFKRRGFYQAILSAMEHDSLVKSLKDKGIFGYFDDVTGINNHYAHSKVEIGVELLGKMGFDKKEVILFGDSLHDQEVAEELNLDYILISNGHQSKERLMEKTSFVLNELKQVLDLLE